MAVGSSSVSYRQIKLVADDTCFARLHGAYIAFQLNLRYGLLYALAESVRCFFTRTVAVYHVEARHLDATIGRIQNTVAGVGLRDRLIRTVVTDIDSDRVGIKNGCFCVESKRAGGFPVLRNVLEDEFDGNHFSTSLSDKMAAFVYGANGKLLRVVDENAADESELPETEGGETFNVRGMPLQDSKAGFQLKKDLIASANESVVLSGNYCGGEAFDEVLDLLADRMGEKEGLKVLVISSSKFVTNNNKNRLDNIKNNYPDRFEYVPSDDYFMSADQLKKVTNHVKGLVVDGRYSVMGGSGIEDKYAYYEGVGDRYRETDTEGRSLGFFNEVMLPRGFRDMDFYFEGESHGIRLQKEILRLAKVWSQYNTAFQSDDIPSYVSTDSRFIDELLSYTEELGSERHSLVSDELDGLEEMDSSEEMDSLEEMDDLDSCNIQLYSLGPELGDDLYLERLINAIKNARRYIYIAHMYVHWPDSMLNALARKVNQGVRLLIVTNGNEDFSPKGHKFFGSRNRVEIFRLKKRIQRRNLGNVSVYEYGRKEKNLPRKTSFHKKVIIVDDEVFAGSGNLGYKSLVTNSDHEINFVVTSPAFANRTIDIIMDDAENIMRVPESRSGNKPPKSLSKRVNLRRFNVTKQEKIFACIHKRQAWLYG